MKTIQTSRFGEIEIQEEHLIHFSDGIIGFSMLKDYVLIESPQMPLLLWLQSVDAADIAFPVTEPYFFRRDYKAPMTDADKCCLNYVEGDVLKFFVIMTVPHDMTRMTVNMKAPLVVDIAKARGTQLVLQDRSFEVKTPAYEAFNHAMASLPVEVTSENAEPTTEEWSIVPLRERNHEAA